jgi:hypothetical protein
MFDHLELEWRMFGMISRPSRGKSSLRRICVCVIKCAKIPEVDPNYARQRLNKPSTTSLNRPTSGLSDSHAFNIDDTRITACLHRLGRMKSACKGTREGVKLFARVSSGTWSSLQLLWDSDWQCSFKANNARALRVQLRIVSQLPWWRWRSPSAFASIRRTALSRYSLANWEVVSEHTDGKLALTAEGPSLRLFRITKMAGNRRISITSMWWPRSTQGRMSYRGSVDVAEKRMEGGNHCNLCLWLTVQPWQAERRLAYHCWSCMSNSTTLCQRAEFPSVLSSSRQVLPSLCS